MESGFSQFHDAKLIAVEVGPKQNIVVLSFSLSNGEQKRIQLEDVIHFRATDFIFQSIVSRLLLSADGKFELEEIRHWVLWVTSLTDTPTFASAEQIDAIIASIVEGEWYLFVVEPSFGAEIAIVTRSHPILIEK